MMWTMPLQALISAPSRLAGLPTCKSQTEWKRERVYV